MDQLSIPNQLGSGRECKISRAEAQVVPIRITWDDMQVYVQHFLSGNTPIRQEQVDSLTLEPTGS
jgi:hypothetical protein